MKIIYTLLLTISVTSTVKFFHQSHATNRKSYRSLTIISEFRFDPRKYDFDTPIHRKIKNARDEERHKRKEAALRFLRDAQKFGYTDNLHESGIFDKGYHFVSHSGHDPFDDLRQDDIEKSLPLRIAEYFRRFVLPFGNRLDAAAVNLRKVCGIINNERDNSCKKTRPCDAKIGTEIVIEPKTQKTRTEVDDEQLQHERRAAYDEQKRFYYV